MLLAAFIDYYKRFHRKGGLPADSPLAFLRLVLI